MDRPRLNVLYISRGYSTHDRRFLGSFAEAGWKPTHLPMTDERLDSRPLPDAVTSLAWGDSVWPTTRSHWKRRVHRLRTVLDHVNPDVVIAGPVQHGALIAALAGAEPLVTVSWGSDILVDADKTALCTHATRRTLEASDLVFGDCLAVREAVKKHGGPDDDHIVTFPWGVDLDRYAPGSTSLDTREKLGWEENDVFISTRSWEPLYAIDILLKGFALLHSARPGVRLVLIGDGSLSSEIRQLIASLGIGDLVHMPGRVPQSALPDWLRLADVYVSSALSDGSSISLLEAMATGLPVVATECFGNLEWVTPGVNGELAEPGSADALRSAMERVVSNPENAGSMGSRNIEITRAKANWNHNFPALVQAIERIVAT